MANPAKTIHKKASVARHWLMELQITYVFLRGER